MRLDKWYYTNQEAQHAKHDAQRLVSKILGYPPDVYERKPVKVETVNLPSYDDLISMVVDDGFPEWEDVFRSWKKEFITAIAVQWTRLSYLREISEREYNTVFLSDNMYPLVSYDQLKHLLYVVPDDVYAVNLIYRSTYPHRINPVPVHRSFNEYNVVSHYIAPGFYYLFTPQGAGAFLDMWRVMPEVDFREVVSKGWEANPNGFPLEKWNAIQPRVIRHASQLLDDDTNSVLSARDHR